MWISKKKYEEFEKKISELEVRVAELEIKYYHTSNIVLGLSKAHKEIPTKYGFTRYIHFDPVVNTQNAEMVTLEELARLVIDGKPIKRETKEKRYIHIFKKKKGRN